MDKKTPLPVTAKEHPLPADIVMEKPDSFGSAIEKNSWDLSINKLKNEIQTRHYSKKTLKAYSLRAEKLRYFAREKVPETLMI